MPEQAAETAVAPIKIECTVEGHESEVAFYKRRGWTFKHFRLWEQSPTEDLVGLVMERLEGWNITDDDGKDIKFRPYIIEENPDPDAEPKLNPEAWDDLSPGMAAWIVGSFRMAYLQAGMPDPNT